jgi:hypothetical protein
MHTAVRVGSSNGIVGASMIRAFTGVFCVLAYRDGDFSVGNIGESEFVRQETDYPVRVPHDANVPIPALRTCCVRAALPTMSQSPEASSLDLNRPPSYTDEGRVRGPLTSIMWITWLFAGVIGIALVAYVFAILSGPVLRQWDTYLSFSHLYVWTTELRASDVLSTWTPLDANGYGSPLPFFYHKLFNLIGAALSIAGGDIVVGYRLTILVFSATLFGGTYMCSQRLGADRISALALATASVLAPYYLCKIYFGTIADYSAAALIPLICALMLDAHAGRFGIRKAVGLFAALLLLELAHVLVAAMAFGVLIPVAVYLSIATRRAYLALIATLLAVIVFVVFFYVPFSYWSAEFSPAQAFIGGGVENHLYTLRDVLSPSPLSSFGWPFYALIAGVALYAFRGRRSGDPRIHAAFVMGCFSLAIVFMTLKITRPFWLLGGPLEFIQFPFRLLSVATPLCLVAVAGLLAQLSPGARRYAQLGLVLFALANATRLAIIALHATTPYVPADNIISHAELNREIPPTQVIGPDAGGEYLPAFMHPALARIDVFKTPIRTILPAPRPFIEARGCRVPAMDHPATLHLLQLSVTCASGGTVRINQFATSMLESSATNGNATIQPRADSPFIDFTLPPGQWTVTVNQRTWLELSVLAWRAKLARIL